MLWNNLQNQFKQMLSLNNFKSSIRNKPKRKEILYYGERWAMIHHSRIRLGCSLLKGHLFQNLHVIDDGQCNCGFEIESTKHFLLDCPLYNKERLEMNRTVSRVTNISVMNLLYGDPDLSINDNKIIFDAVHLFLKESGRFASQNFI